MDFYILFSIRYQRFYETANMEDDLTLWHPAQTDVRNLADIWNHLKVYKRVGRDRNPDFNSVDSIHLVPDIVEKG